MSFIEDVKKFLKNANANEKNAFIDQILKEKDLKDTLESMGLSPTSGDVRERTRELPFGVMSLVEKVAQIDLVSLITEIASIVNIESLDLIDRITLIDDITQISNILNIDSIDLIDNITNVGTLNLLNTVNLVKTISSITNIASLDLLDRITLIDDITNIGTIANLTTIGTITNPVKIKTATDDNILIDLLKQGAFYERRSYIQNNGVTPVWTSVVGDARRGKFFARGCRGFINTIDVYCKNTAVASNRKIYIYISPNFSLGYILSAEINMANNAPAQWRNATINKMWNYDSMLIFVVGETAEAQWATDNEDADKNDYWDSADKGATWTFSNFRGWFRASMKGQTVAEVIPSTVNTIEIPHTSSGEETSEEVNLPDATETTVWTVNGAGHMDWFTFTVSHGAVDLKIYCDGKLAFWDNPVSMTGKGITPTTPAVQLPIYVAEAGCLIMSNLRFEFKRKLEFKCRNDTGAVKTAELLNSLITMLD